LSKADEIFIQNCKDILERGVWDTDRAVRPHWEDGAPAHTIKLFGVVNRYDLREEFPILTVRKQFLKSAIDELLWIWQQKSNNIHDLSSHVWDSWADESGSIGKAYGYQLGKRFRHHKFVDGEVLDTKLYPSICVKPYGATGGGLVPHSMTRWVCMDQVDAVLYDLRNNPASRRIMTNIFNHEELADMGLQPCAYSMTFNVSGNTLNGILNQRSQDMLTANGWNVMQYAILLLMVARSTGLETGELVHVIADAHIYDRHVPVVKQLIEREPFAAPKLKVDPDVHDFYDFTKQSFTLVGYQAHALDNKIPVAI